MSTTNRVAIQTGLDVDTDSYVDLDTESPAGTALARIRRVSKVVFAAMLVAAVALAVFATVVPWSIQRGGEKLVTITSGSMTPLIPVGGTITIHTPVDVQTLQPGQIITFRANAQGLLISHRIVKRVINAGDRGVFYQTKGDANRTPDADLRPASNVVGVVDDVLPEWKTFAVSLQTPRGRLVAYGPIFLLVAIAEIGAIIVAARRKDEDEDES